VEGAHWVDRAGAEAEIQRSFQRAVDASFFTSPNYPPGFSGHPLD